MKVLLILFIGAGTLAQSLVDVEQIRQNIAKNNEVKAVIAEDTVESRLAALAEQEKKIQESLSSQKSVVEENKNTAKPENVKEEPVKKAELVKKEEASQVAPKVEQPKNDQELENAKKRIAQLQKELSDTKGKLILAEQEVERLTYALDQRNKEALSAMNVPTGASKARLNPKDLQPLGDVISDKMTSPIPVGTVISQRLSLKVAPNNSSSTIMTVEAGTKLPIEGNQGGWYRVVAPSGVRAWIPSGGVTLGNVGISKAADEAAMNAIRGIGR